MGIKLPVIIVEYSKMRENVVKCTGKCHTQMTLNLYTVSTVYNVF